VRERLLDVRELEPPEPLERALAELDTLAADECLRLVHRREPHLLYPILQREGFDFRTEMTADYTFIVRIWRK
jgi:uncharacterized protein (DUF2249 family)